MRALTVKPGMANSAKVEQLPDVEALSGQLLVRAIAIGVCGTDIEISNGLYGTAPAQAERLIIGHESLGEVVHAPANSGFTPGDRVVGIVRHPDPVPCRNCAAGEWDMCSNGMYLEHGISGLHGFGSELFVLEPEFAVKVDPKLGENAILLEPASIVAKAWEQIARIGARFGAWKPTVVLITGAGPIGLLAALFAKQRMFEVHVFDRAADGPKPHLVGGLGAHYHTGELKDLSLSAPPDVILECTGASGVVLDALSRTGTNGIVCLTGLSSGARSINIDLGDINRRLVLENDCVFGSVNANRRHYEAAATALAAADQEWLAALITRRVPLSEFASALQRRPDDVKVIIDFGPESHA